MKALIIIDNVEDWNLEELGADVKIKHYGDTLAIYNNLTVEPIPNGVDVDELIDVLKTTNLLIQLTGAKNERKEVD